MSGKKDTKTSGAETPDVNLEKITKLTALNDQLKAENDQLKAEKEELLQQNKALTEKINAVISSEDVEDTSGLPAVMKYNGKKYTREDVLANKVLLKELTKMGIVKPLKK